MDLAHLQQQLQQPELSPVESWRPAFCGDIPLRIDADGCWYYQDSKIARAPLVKLFARVLLCQGQEYFLQTPIEKVRIQVADVPFLITQSQWQQGESGPELWLTTNLGDTVPLSAAYPLILRPFAGQVLPYVQLWRGLHARLHRNLYYQLLEEAELEEVQFLPAGDFLGETHLSCVIQSAGQRFLLAEERLNAADT